MALIGSNKTMATQRIESGAYAANLSGIKMRYEPIPPSKPNEYVTKAMHCIFAGMVEQIDLEVADRVLVDDRTFVVAGVSKLDDTVGKHMEFLMREVGSANFHETVKIKTLSDTQENYDPIFMEWSAGEKSYVDTEVSVLMDQAQDAKEKFKLLNEAGKFNDIQWLMTVDLPTSLTTDDRIEYQGNLYRVEWIEDLVWEKLVGLKSDMDNAPTSL